MAFQFFYPIEKSNLIHFSTSQKGSNHVITKKVWIFFLKKLKKIKIGILWNKFFSFIISAQIVISTIYLEVVGQRKEREEKERKKHVFTDWP